MIQKLTERYIIDLMREEWDNKVQSLLVEKKSKVGLNKDHKKGKRRLENEIDVDGDGQPEMVIDRGLRITCKRGPLKGTEYTIDDVDEANDQVVLKRGNLLGREVSLTISFDELRSNYTM